MCIATQYSACVFQASFVRSNLMFRIVNKDNMRTEDGSSIAEERLIEYIRCYCGHRCCLPLIMHAILECYMPALVCRVLACMQCRVKEVSRCTAGLQKSGSTELRYCLLRNQGLRREDRLRLAGGPTDPVSILRAHCLLQCDLQKLLERLCRACRAVGIRCTSVTVRMHGCRRTAESRCATIMQA